MLPGGVLTFMRKISESQMVEGFMWTGAVLLIAWLAVKLLTVSAHAALITNPPPVLKVTTSAASTVIGPDNKSVTFTWDPSPDAAVTGYRFYQIGLTNTLLAVTPTNLITVANINLDVTNTFAVSAVDVFTNESLLSSNVSISLPPAPTNLKPVLFH